jgi:hypothetical protein
VLALSLRFVVNARAAVGSSPAFPPLVVGLIAVASAVGVPDHVFAQSSDTTAGLPAVVVTPDRVAGSIEHAGNAIAVLQGADIATRPMPASTAHGDA